MGELSRCQDHSALPSSSIAERTRASSRRASLELVSLLLLFDSNELSSFFPSQLAFPEENGSFELLIGMTSKSFSSR